MKWREALEKQVVSYNRPPPSEEQIRCACEQAWERLRKSAARHALQNESRWSCIHTSVGNYYDETLFVAKGGTVT